MKDMRKTIAGKTLLQWRRSHPFLNRLMAYKEALWFSTQCVPTGMAVSLLATGKKELMDAEDRLHRFAPFLSRAFPETAGAGGIIESSLQPIPSFQFSISKQTGMTLNGRMLLKRDDLLPVAGSVKARGGIYEVLKLAETLAVQNGMLSADDSYACLLERRFFNFFGQYSITVGSTGNLGLAIGIIGAKLGFRVTVHMSADAKSWKKKLLRDKGVIVVEHADDYAHAVAEGRRRAENDTACHFVDDERSSELFIGYAVAALRLKAQLEKLRIPVDARHPLFVYLPCGVGGAPGGITFGMKMVFGDYVHCLFAEPTHSPAMFIGLYTGMHHAVCVRDFGIDNRTDADGLAVGRPSGLVTKRIRNLVDGVFTVSDETLYRMMALLNDSENIFMEPSALAGLPGILRVSERPEYIEHHGLTQLMESSTHIAWGTGGSMVPAEVRGQYYRKSEKIQMKRRMPQVH